MHTHTHTLKGCGRKAWWRLRRGRGQSKLSMAKRMWTEIVEKAVILKKDYAQSHRKHEHIKVGGSDGKVSACSAGDLGSIPGLARSLEKEMATHSSTLAWKISWMEELLMGYSLWARQESDTTE